MKLIITALTLLLALGIALIISAESELNVEASEQIAVEKLNAGTTPTTKTENQNSIAEPEVDIIEQQSSDLSDLETIPGENWRPRSYDFRANCDRANVDERLPPAVWFNEFQDTRDKVFEEASYILGTGQQPLVGEHTNFWEVWCPPTGWEDQHIILLVGLYLLEDAYYFENRYTETGNNAYRERADFSFSESERYIYQGIRDAIPWYGDMPIFSDDSRVDTCLLGGPPDGRFVPLCDDYEGPITDPRSPHYSPNYPRIDDLPSN